MNLLQLSKIHLSFDNNILFDNLNLIVEANKIVIIRTGVLNGGTSLLNLINSTLTPLRGSVHYSGKDSTTLTNFELFKTVGIQFEDEGLLSMYTVKENCQLPLSFHTNLSKGSIINKIAELSSYFEFDEFLDKYPYQLNDVQLKLANLLRVLVIEPKILLLDELQSGMSDQLRRKLLYKLVAYLKKTQSIIMTTNAGDVDDFANEKYEISNKNLVRI